MTAEIHNINCITRFDLPAEQVLQGAIDSGLKGVIIAGWDEDGDLYCASSYADGGDALWLVEKFKQKLMEVTGD